MAGTTHRRVLSGLELVTAATYAEKGNRKKISRNVKNSGADTPTTTSCKETKKDSYFKYMQRHALPYFTAYLPWGAVGNILEWKCGTDMSVRSKDETPEILWGLPADSAPSKHKKEVQKGFLSHIENWFLSLSHFLSSSKWWVKRKAPTALFCPVSISCQIRLGFVVKTTTDKENQTSFVSTNRCRRWTISILINGDWWAKEMKWKKNGAIDDGFSASYLLTNTINSFIKISAICLFSAKSRTSVIKLM